MDTSLLVALAICSILPIALLATLVLWLCRIRLTVRPFLMLLLALWGLWLAAAGLMLAALSSGVLNDGGMGAAALLGAILLAGLFAAVWLTAAPLLGRYSSASLRQCLLAGGLLALLLPGATVGAGFAVSEENTRITQEQNQRRFGSREQPLPTAATDYGLPVPAGFQPLTLAAQEYSPEYRPLDPGALASGAQAAGTIYHQQHHGYQGGTALSVMLWEQMVEQALQESAAGLAAAGYSLYLGRGRQEQTDIYTHHPGSPPAQPGPMRSYHEPVLVGVNGERLVGYHIIPNPAAFGSHPEIRVAVHYGDGAQLVVRYRERYALEPLAWPAAGRALFDIRKGPADPALPAPLQLPEPAAQ